MRHAAWHFASLANQEWQQGKRWEAIFCTDMLNAAEFRGLVLPEIARLPLVIYFHENQFAYPDRLAEERDLHFAITNFSSALCADEIWFNSSFNQNSLQKGLLDLCKKWPDYAPRSEIESLPDKSIVIHPGIDTPESFRDHHAPTKIHVVWAARWEHDKGPDDLLKLLIQLEQSCDFQISILGQRFRHQPPAFAEIEKRFTDRIVRTGFQPTRSEYWDALSAGDVFLSTAQHEFFGLAAAEAIAAGLYPVLPNRLAYPELLNGVQAEPAIPFLYHSVTDAVNQLSNVKRNWQAFQTLDLANSFRRRLCIRKQAGEMDLRLVDLKNGHPT